MTELAVYKSIAKITGELARQGISKDRKNQQQGYAFRGIDDIYNTLSKLLAENELCIFPFCEYRETTERNTQKGGVIFYTTVKMKYKLISAVDGSSVECCTVGEAMDSADKSTNKAMSAAYKYLCLQIFCIPTEGDNDADATTPPPVIPQKKVLTFAERVEKFKTFIKNATLDDINKNSTTFTELKDKADPETAAELLKLWNDRCQVLMSQPIEEK
jgi:hypothetical protein